MVLGGPIETMTETIQAPDLITSAQQKCWEHVEVATTMTRTLEALRGLEATSLIPILSDNMPTLMITPDRANELIAVKAVIRWITNALEQSMIRHSGEWERIPVNDEWTLRLRCDNRIIIDIMTRLPATKEATIEV